MTDVPKKGEPSKIAEGLKLLKQHQKTKTKKRIPKPETTQADIDDNTNRSVSSNRSAENQEDHFGVEIHDVSKTDNPFQNYFQVDYSQQGAYFSDNVTPRTNANEILPSTVIPNTIEVAADSISYDDPELKPYEVFNNIKAESMDVVSINDANSDRRLPHYVSNNVENVQYLQTNSSNAVRGSHDSIINILKRENDDYMSKISELEDQLTNTKIELERQHQLELESVHDQLKSHAQTIGILISEKSELAVSLSEMQLRLEQHSYSNNELKDQLQKSKGTIDDQEKQILALRNESAGLRTEFTKNSEKQFESSVRQLQEERDRAVLDASEMSARLAGQESDNIRLQQCISDLRGQLDMTKIKIQQLTISDASTIDHQRDIEMETLTNRNFALEKQVLDINALIEASNNEKNESNLQYQQYHSQLNAQITSLMDQLQSLTIENEQLAKREESLIAHIGNIERNLQQQPQIADKESHIDKELLKLRDEFEKMSHEHKNLREQFDFVKSERDEFLKNNALKQDEIVGLQEKLNDYEKGQMDSGKLLASMESDRIAASLATKQNVALKAQLEEMHDAFIKSANDKAQLADSLNSEQYRNKELQEQMGKLEHQLHTLINAIEVKDREFMKLKQEVHHECSHDHVPGEAHHLHNHDHESSPDYIDTNAENVEIKPEISESVVHEHQLEESCENERSHDHQHSSPHHHHHSHAEKSSRTEDELQLEIFKLKQRCDELQQLNIELTGDENYSVTIEANKKLAEKFTKTMDDIASLEDEKQRLEHLVLQLQGETETIGEYAALYQEQRAALMIRSQECDDLLRQLNIDQEEVKLKVQQLNDLINRLMKTENLDPQVIEQQRQLNDGVRTSDTLSVQPDDKTEIAGQIRDLITDIKSSNLMHSNNFTTPSLHACSWCSGKLITI